MSITIVNYHDHALIDRINTKATARAEAAREQAARAEAARLQAQTSGQTAQGTENADFSTVLKEAENSYTNTQNTSSSVNCPEDLNTIFEQASDTYNVSSNLLKAIAKAESNFRADAVSRAGAVGIMQLMPATAASLGVTNSYDATQNILGGAKYIGQLLQQYNGNVSLALAAYNAGSGNVAKYGGIPPFSETQNYVKKVLSYFDEGVTIPDSANTGTSSSSGLSDSTKEDLTDMLSSFLSSKNISSDTVELIAALLNTIISKVDDVSDKTDSSRSDTASNGSADSETAASSNTASTTAANNASGSTAAPTINVSVVSGTDLPGIASGENATHFETTGTPPIAPAMADSNLIT